MPAQGVSRQEAHEGSQPQQTSSGYLQAGQGQIDVQNWCYCKPCYCGSCVHRLLGVMLPMACMCRAGSAEVAGTPGDAEGGELREVKALADATPIGTDVLAHIQSRLRPVELYAVRFLEEVGHRLTCCVLLSCVKDVPVSA